MIFKIYLLGVMINFIVVIMIFSNEEFKIIDKRNELLSNWDKIALLGICFLSWILIIHSLIRNR